MRRQSAWRLETNSAFKKGENALGRLVAALRRIGFDEVYDTNFGADLNGYGRVKRTGRTSGIRRKSSAVYVLLSGMGKIL